MTNRVLVTGANGFIGKALVKKLFEKSTYSLRVVVRNKNNIKYDDKIEVSCVPDISKETDWSFILTDCNIIIHTAAKVHVMKNNASDPFYEYRRINVEGTLNLAKQAAKYGVRRFIFLSSIKVNGDETFAHNPFQPEVSTAPEDPYALSKYEAESKLMALGTASGMEIVIIRPPLVYGPGVKGNFERLISWLKKGYPLPLGSIHNKRSFVSVLNLVHLIIHCIAHPKAANQVFLVSDGEDISTTELLKRLGESLASPAKLLPIPVWILSGLGTLLGRKEMAQRLCGTLQVDISKTCELLEWQPVIGMRDALAEMANYYIHGVQ